MVEKLGDLVLFVAVVERAGFAAAARHLGMQRSKLSRRIGELERRLGVRLLQRNTRHVSLTPAGERIYEHARKVVDEARAAFDIAAELAGEPRGLLRISCPAPFAAKALMPVLAEFEQRYPQLRILIEATGRVSDLVEDGFELAFRIQGAPLDDSSLVARFVATVPMAIVASPAFIDAHDTVHHPRQLAEVPLLLHGSHHEWQPLRFCRHLQDEYVLDSEPKLISGNLMVLEAAAIASLGAACLPRYLCREALLAGRLVELFAPDTDWTPQPAQLYAIIPSRRGITLAMRLFLEFAMTRLAGKLE